jgi:acetylornithine deacetylase/succinyl-diaminopimelate desuccinylase-like protein
LKLQPTKYKSNYSFYVVPVDEKFWEFDPLSGEIKDGYILGRGAIDTKSSGILHFSAFLALHQ